MAAAVALVASIGVGSASGAVLCTESVNPCPAPEPGGTAISADLAAGVNAVLSAPTFKTECSASTWKAETKNKGGAGERVTLNLNQLSFTECKCGITSLVSVAHIFVEKIGFLELEAIAGAPNGTMLDTETAITIDCTDVLACKYGVTTPARDTGTLKGGNPATAEVSLILSLINGDGGLFMCGNSVSLSAKYEITSPKPLYVEPE